ncbi:type II toxin-antitoxin system RelE/ParE family toxin [Bosea sp. (in: a-proteobacteria)]|uniref:type II toxin-antitoxin system RelE/ParE family toxin n=1 Tax=Bosea sp. (in: a-proteobacteria) TaxID=1871050 RepID=UPI002732FFD3|nr:type II toxin-antitoxin system RelE/ParE family toxin [Bosea sp. (in: a-proteobacteria)]
MVWAVQSVSEFERWFLTLESGVRVEIAAKISLLQQVGPTLGRPHADTLKGSAYPNMKELRVQIGGDPWRILFAFDPKTLGHLAGRRQQGRRWPFL